jgi:hypothetical protein
VPIPHELPWRGAAASTLLEPGDKERVWMKILSPIAAIVLLGVAGCGDKQCRSELRVSTTRIEQMQRALDAARKENAMLRAKAAKMNELIAHLAAVTIENEELRATAAKASRP